MKINHGKMINGLNNSGAEIAFGFFNALALADLPRELSAGANFLRLVYGLKTCNSKCSGSLLNCNDSLLGRIIL